MRNALWQSEMGISYLNTGGLKDSFNCKASFFQNVMLCTPSIFRPDMHPGELLQGIGEIKVNPDTKLPVFPDELIFSTYGRYYLNYSCYMDGEIMGIGGPPIYYLPADYSEQMSNLWDVMKKVKL